MVVREKGKGGHQTETGTEVDADEKNKTNKKREHGFRASMSLQRKVLACLTFTEDTEALVVGVAASRSETSKRYEK